MNTLFNNNEDMEITPIGKGFGLKKIITVDVILSIFVLIAQHVKE